MLPVRETVKREVLVEPSVAAMSAPTMLTMGPRAAMLTVASPWRPLIW